MSVGEVGDQFDGPWEIGWPRESFLAVKSDERFAALLTIGRLRNFLRFIQGVIAFQPPELTEPASRRHSLNAYFLMNSALVEVENTINNCGQFFHEESAYRGLVAELRSPKLQALIARSRQVRKWSVFHFDRKAVEEVADKGHFADPPEFVRFFSGHGKLDFGIYCDLGDEAPFELALGGMDEATLAAWFRTASSATTSLFRTLDHFLVRMAKQIGAIERSSTD